MTTDFLSALNGVAALPGLLPGVLAAAAIGLAAILVIRAALR